MRALLTDLAVRALAPCAWAQEPPAVTVAPLAGIAGLFSPAFGLGGHSLIWGPVAASIVWGIGFSTVLTLSAMPLLYRALMPEHRARRLKTAMA